MTTPPVDPWSGQPEHGSPTGHYPPPSDGPPAPPEGPHTPPPGGGWPTTPYPGAATPQSGGWPDPQSAPPADSYPGPQYGGWSQPDPAQGGYPTPPHSGPPGAPSSGYPATPQSGPPAGYPGMPQSGPPAGYPGAPQSGPPAGYPGAPQSGYPAAPQPGYQGTPQPGYPGPQPGYPGAPRPGGYPEPAAPQYAGFGGAPYSAPPGLPHGPAPQRSKLPLLLTLGLAGLLVLCLGGGGLTWVALSDDDPKTPTPSPTPTAVTSPTPSPTPVETDSETPEPTPTESADDPGPIRLVTPTALGGRSKSTDPELRRIADQMVRDMKSEVRNETGAVSAFYGSAASRNMVMMAGASGPVILPEQELDDAVKGLGSSLAVTKMSTIDPGPLGGVAKCGDGKASGIALGVCVWADHGSVGMIVMYFSSASKAKSEFVSIRGQIEKRD
ncbi:hypothetical protein AB0B63_22795 [Micromonospora sp. NPDC049081]|uniref:hypothetical protein n=1 Tax=Micromonospora sp. NPDC049081 TaxID=3155150 RepID=UPI0033F70EAD